ncbi:MAG: hypothetical protein HY870_09845, partial [Chloroflexi bacterium]|nr:hypothetical protein [Chloroflexota bacterium]
MEKESYTAFYASRPFWAASKVDFTVPRVEGWFNRQMAEVVYNKSTPEFSLKICRDGQVLLRVNRLERPSGIEPSSPIGDIVRRWGEYLDYLNCFYLFLDSSSIEIDRRAYFNLHEITYRDAFRITFEDGKEVSQSIPAESIASVFQMGRYLSTYRADLPIEYDTRLFHRQIISLEAISLAGEKLLAV